MCLELVPILGLEFPADATGVGIGLAHGRQLALLQYPHQLLPQLSLHLRVHLRPYHTEHIPHDRLEAVVRAVIDLGSAASSV